MKKEIKELLNSKEGTLRINELFTLRRWLSYYSDGKLFSDGLELVMENEVLKPHHVGSVTIKARDTQGIMDEVAAGIEKLMTKHMEQMMRNVKGGRLR